MNNLNFSITMDASDFLQMSDRIHELEKACEEKDNKIKELEYQLGCMGVCFGEFFHSSNSENTFSDGEEELCEMTGHQLLVGRQILVLGACVCKPKNLLGYAKRNFGFINTDFRFVSDYAKIKNRQIRLSFDKLAGIIIGPVPHYSEDTSKDLMKFIMDWQDIVPVMICRSKNGEIKISKQAFADSLIKLMSDIKLSL